jgi:glycosyltransferase involved in cell wall biosynthesis
MFGHDRPRRMLIDVTRLVGRRQKGRLPTGVDRVGLAYVERYAFGRHGAPAHAQPAQALIRFGPVQCVLPARASRQVFRWLVGEVARLPAAALLAGSLRALVDACWRALRPDREQRDTWLVHAVHSGLEDPSWAGRWRAGGARALLVVHDLIPITHPQFCRTGEAERHARRMRHALQWGSVLVANSHATLRTLTAWADAQRIAPPATAVAHLGPAAAPTAPTCSVPPLAGPYFVVIGTLEPRKNHALLLKVWERLVQRHGTSAAPRLVLIGQRGWDIESLARELERSPALQEVVIERPDCGDAELARWLGHARALLLPSFAEGYGLPLIEALAARVPVLASDLAVFRELAGSLPDYLDPIDGLAWLSAIEDYARPGSAARAAQLRGLAGFEAPTWRAHFQAVDRLILQFEST